MWRGMTFCPEVCNVRRLKSGMVMFVPFAHKNSRTEDILPVWLATSSLLTWETGWLIGRRR